MWGWFLVGLARKQFPDWHPVDLTKRLNRREGGHCEDHHTVGNRDMFTTQLLTALVLITGSSIIQPAAFGGRMFIGVEYAVRATSAESLHAQAVAWRDAPPYQRVAILEDLLDLRERRDLEQRPVPLQMGEVELPDLAARVDWLIRVISDVGLSMNLTSHEDLVTGYKCGIVASSADMRSRLQHDKFIDLQVRGDVVDSGVIVTHEDMESVRRLLDAWPPLGAPVKELARKLGLEPDALAGAKVITLRQESPFDSLQVRFLLGDGTVRSVRVDQGG